ncbi:MAG TPA: glycosyltransferase family A protein [Edaphobacter sp.]|nr:glycosyltransferase family A protein [Edaphobacter sp.]
MSDHRQVKVSLGIPVYNGERFVGSAIQSALDQTLTDFEVIVCDNASTDRTPEICEEFARKDPRLRYFRHEINLGAKANFNRVFEYSRGEYFKWIAADDVCGPRYLELTVAALDQDPAAVLAHTLSRMIDSKGDLVTAEALERGVIWDEGFPVDVRPTDCSRRLDVALPHKRFQAVLLSTYWCFEIYALIRREAMLRTYPTRPYYGSDKVMLAQLSLLGRFVEIPQVQFFRRAHHGNSTNLPARDREKWSHAPKTHWKLPTQFPCLEGYTACALTFPLSFPDRMKCLGVIARFLARPGRYPNLARQILNIGGHRKTGSIVAAPKPVH